MASHEPNPNPHLDPNQLMGSTAAGRKGIKEGKSGEGLRRLIERYVLSNPAKAEMQALLDAMNKDDEVAAVLHGQRSALLKRFSAVASKRSSVRAAPQHRRSTAAAPPLHRRRAAARTGTHRCATDANGASRAPRRRTLLGDGARPLSLPRASQAPRARRAAPAPRQKPCCRRSSRRSWWRTCSSAG